MVDLSGLSREERSRVETVIRRADRPQLHRRTDLAAERVGRTDRQLRDAERLSIRTRTSGPTSARRTLRFQTPRSGHKDTTMQPSRTAAAAPHAAPRCSRPTPATTNIGDGACRQRCGVDRRQRPSRQVRAGPRAVDQRLPPGPAARRHRQGRHREDHGRGRTGPHPGHRGPAGAAGGGRGTAGHRPAVRRAAAAVRGAQGRGGHRRRRGARAVHRRRGGPAGVLRDLLQPGLRRPQPEEDGCGGVRHHAGAGPAGRAAHRQGEGDRHPAGQRQQTRSTTPS